MARLNLGNSGSSPFQRALANAPGIRDSFLQMEAALKGILEPELLEMLRLRSAANNGCDY